MASEEVHRIHGTFGVNLAAANVVLELEMYGTVGAVQAVGVESVTAQVFLGHMHTFHLFLFVTDLLDVVYREVKAHLLEVPHHGFRSTAGVGLGLLVAFYHGEFVAVERRGEFLGQELDHHLESHNLLCHIGSNHAGVVRVGNELREGFTVATSGTHYKRNLVFHVKGSVVVYRRGVGIVDADQVGVLGQHFANAFFTIARLQKLDGLPGHLGFVLHDNLARQRIRDQFQTTGHASFGHNAAHVARNSINHHFYRHCLLLFYF